LRSARATRSLDVSLLLELDAGAPLLDDAVEPVLEERVSDPVLDDAVEPVPEERLSELLPYVSDEPELRFMLRSEGVVRSDGLFMLVEGAGFDPPLDELSAGPFLISGPVAGLLEVCACVNPIAPTTATVLIIETTNLDAFISILLPVGWLCQLISDSDVVEMYSPEV